MTSRKTIDKAIALISAGWCQRTFSKEIGKNEAYCLLGALNHVHTSAFLKGQVRNFIPKDFTGMVSWNDKPGRTKAEVIDLLDRVRATLV